MEVWRGVWRGVKWWSSVEGWRMSGGVEGCVEGC